MLVLRKFSVEHNPNPHYNCKTIKMIRSLAFTLLIVGTVTAAPTTSPTEEQLKEEGREFAYNELEQFLKETDGVELKKLYFPQLVDRISQALTENDEYNKELAETVKQLKEAVSNGVDEATVKKLHEITCSVHNERHLKAKKTLASAIQWLERRDKAIQNVLSDQYIDINMVETELKEAEFNIGVIAYLFNQSIDIIKESTLESNLDQEYSSNINGLQQLVTDHVFIEKTKSAAENLQRFLN